MKKLVLFVLVCFVLFGLSACQFSEHGELYDNEDRLVATGDTYSFLGKYYTHDEITFKRFSGIYTLKSITQDDPFRITINMDISNGKFKCFLVDENDQLIELVQGDNEISSYVGRLRLRIAGDDARGKMSFTIS